MISFMAIILFFPPGFKVCLHRACLSHVFPDVRFTCGWRIRWHFIWINTAVYNSFSTLIVCWALNTAKTRGTNSRTVAERILCKHWRRTEAAAAAVLLSLWGQCRRRVRIAGMICKGKVIPAFTAVFIVYFFYAFEWEKPNRSFWFLLAMRVMLSWSWPWSFLLQIVLSPNLILTMADRKKLVWVIFRAIIRVLLENIGRWPIF